jgi:hypothetical protein
VPPHILCRPNTVRYSLVLNVHDQRHRHSISSKNIKVSSPTLRKICLPCITARHPPHPHHHHHRHRHHHSRHQLSSSRKTSKTNLHHRLAPNEDIINDDSSLERFAISPKTYDPSAILPVVHSNDECKGNDANHLLEQHQHSQTLVHKESNEELHNEILPTKAELKSISSESIMSVSVREKTEFNDNDAVGSRR